MYDFSVFCENLFLQVTGFKRICVDLILGIWIWLVRVSKEAQVQGKRRID